MDQIGYWLPLVWAGVIGLAVALYVILDGFDLGIGILFLTGADESERDDMMNAIAPYWDGNETWLVLGGGGLLAAFPLAYGIILPALYIPLIFMLLALIFRGVAFEFRFVSKPHNKWWDRAFAGGSTVATFCQGLVLGGFLQDIAVSGLPNQLQFSGGAFDWLTPFSLMCGFGMLAGYTLLGSAWLMMKTEGEVEKRAQGVAGYALALTLIFMAAVSLWTPLVSDRIAERWFHWDRLAYLWFIPFLTAIFAWTAWSGIRKGSGIQAFLSSIALFLLGFAGLAVSTFPYLVPPSVTIWQAAAVPESQIMLLIGALILLPLILGYTIFVYWTFRGKVASGGGYH
jgi:cytochrome d ubiquinol oxidase subunit II